MIGKLAWHGINNVIILFNFSPAQFFVEVHFLVNVSVALVCDYPTRMPSKMRKKDGSFFLFGITGSSKFIAQEIVESVEEIKG